MLIYLPCVCSLITYYVFTSKGIDYRAVAIGSLLPFFIDIFVGHASFGHSLLFPVSLLVLVMVGTIGRSRMLRRQLLCIVIGVFLALVLEGTFLHESTWWWPTNVGQDANSIDITPRLWVWVLRDGVGLVAFYILFSIGELHKKVNRQQLLSTGRISS